MHRTVRPVPQNFGTNTHIVTPLISGYGMVWWPRPPSHPVERFRVWSHISAGPTRGLPEARWQTLPAPFWYVYISFHFGWKSLLNYLIVSWYVHHPNRPECARWNLNKYKSFFIPLLLVKTNFTTGCGFSSAVRGSAQGTAPNRAVWTEWTMIKYFFPFILT